MLFPVLLCLLFLTLLNGCVREHQTARLKSAKNLLGRQEKDLHHARRNSLALEARAQALAANLEEQKATEEERIEKKAAAALPDCLLDCLIAWLPNREEGSRCIESATTYHDYLSTDPDHHPSSALLPYQPYRRSHTRRRGASPFKWLRRTYRRSPDARAHVSSSTPASPRQSPPRPRLPSRPHAGRR